MMQCLGSPVVPFDILHSVIIPEVILEYLHSVLVTGEDLSWNAFTTLPLICTEFNRSCRTWYRTIFGLESRDYSIEQVQTVYSRARKAWLRARGLMTDSEDDLIIRYRELMATKSLIQIYICLAYSRRFLNLDILSPLFYRNRSSLLPDRLKPVELLESKTSQEHNDQDEEPEAGIQSYHKMRDETMHRLFMPLTCVMKLCDIITPPSLTQRIAKFTADIAPYCTTIPVLLKYVQDLERYINQDYPVPLDVQAGWALQSLDLITQVDTFFERFRESGHMVSSFLELDKVPKRIYEIVDLPRVLTQVTETDWGRDSEQIHHDAREIITKLNTLC